MFTLFIIFLFGICLGSFLNVVIYRLNSGERIVNSRSHCSSCKKNLKWSELIPVASFIIQKGKCRSCGKKISWQYILVELSTGLALVFAWLALNNLNINGWRLFGYGLLWTYFVAVLIIIFVYDLKYFLIPDVIIYPAIIITSLWNLALVMSKQVLPQYYLLSAIIPAAVFLSLIVVSRGRWMGMGDVKLVFLLGLFLGFPKIVLALFIAFTLGSVVGLGLIFFKKYSFKSPIPFGTFLAIGAAIALFFGGAIIQWYFKIIGVMHKF